MRLYPLYIEPEPFRFKYSGERSRKEQLEYFEWFTVHYKDRIPLLLHYFNYHLTGDCETDLEELGSHVAEMLKNDWMFQYESDSFVVHGIPIQITDEKAFTPYADSMAIDMGLFLYSCLESLGPERAAWTLITKPKRDIDYGSPLIMNPYEIRFEAKRMSVAYLGLILDGKSTSSIWADVYRQFRDRWISV